MAHTYAITGGCGFIGSHIAERLLETRPGCTIRIIDDLSSGRESNIAQFRDRVTFTRADIRNRNALIDLFSGVDYVFHQAALVSVFDSINRPFDNHEINLTGFLNVLHASQENGVRRVVTASSAAIYGNDPRLPKRESMRPRPESPYGLAKITNEYYARVYSHLFNLPVVCLRYFNVFGPRQDPGSPYSGVISIFANRLLAGSPITIYGDGRQTRDFVFVRDVAQANDLAMHNETLAGAEVFNVATGHGTSLLDLLNTMKSIAGSHMQPAFEPERAGDIKHSHADISLISKALGYAPEYSLSQGLKQLMDFCRFSA